MAGVSLKDLSEILPTSLLPGYGEKVCLFLLLLCGVVLKKKNHTWLPLNYKNMIRNEKKSVNSNGNIEYDEWIDQVINSVVVFILNYLLHFILTFFFSSVILISFLCLLIDKLCYIIFDGNSLFRMKNHRK